MKDVIYWRFVRIIYYLPASSAFPCHLLSRSPWSSLQVLYGYHCWRRQVHLVGRSPVYPQWHTSFLHIYINETLSINAFLNQTNINQSIKSIKYSYLEHTLIRKPKASCNYFKRCPLFNLTPPRLNDIANDKIICVISWTSSLYGGVNLTNNEFQDGISEALVTFKK